MVAPSHRPNAGGRSPASEHCRALRALSLLTAAAAVVGCLAAVPVYGDAGLSALGR